MDKLFTQIKIEFKFNYCLKGRLVAASVRFELTKKPQDYFVHTKYKQPGQRLH